MTASTSSAQGFSPSEDENENLPSTDEQADALESQLGLASYDPSTDPLLVDLPQLFEAKGGIDPLIEANILSMVAKRQFPSAIQFEMSGGEMRTLGELADSRANEHAQQFIYPEQIKKILWGSWGIAKGKKLSSNIEVTYFRDKEEGLTNMVITSGRHRVTALIALLQFLGVTKWRDQKVQVVVKVVNSDTDFAQLIATANDSRKMSRSEMQVHNLSQRSIYTATPEEFFSTRIKAKKQADVVGCFVNAVRYELVGLPQRSQDALLSCISTGLGKVWKVSKENRNSILAVVVNENAELLKDAARVAAGNVVNYAAQSNELFPDDRTHIGATKVAALDLAKILNVDAPEFS